MQISLRFRFSWIVVLVVALAAWGGPTVAHAEVIGSWNFSTGSLAPVAGTISLSELRTKSYYTTYGGSANIPAVEFVATDAVGIAAPGGTPQTVLRVPNQSGYGPMGGLIAEFPRITNATTNSLNRYTVVMDVLVRQSAYDAVSARSSGRYMSLFQTVASTDADLFIDVRSAGGSRPAGVGGTYGGDVVADQWHRIAWVASLDAATDQPRFTAYVDGLPASTLVWDELLASGDPVKQELADPTPSARAGTLQTDGRFSIYTLGQITSQSVANATGPSAFFLFNDGGNNSGELGEIFVANLQFRDDALSAGAIQSLGGATGGVVPVPEPSTLALTAACLVLLVVRHYRPPSFRAARARNTAASMS